MPEMRQLRLRERSEAVPGSIYIQETPSHILNLVLKSIYYDFLDDFAC